MRLVVAWQEEVGSPGSGDVCSAWQAFDIPVLEPTAPQIQGRFNRGPRTFGSSFLLRLLGQAPQKPGRITVSLRARRGTTKPPAPTGRPMARFVFTPTGNGRFETSSTTREFRRTFYADTVGAGVRVYPYPNIPFGRTLRFGFSLEVTQDGRRIGGMRSGAACRRIQFSGHSAVKCQAVGLKQQP